jgi:hypothetical protein
MSNPKISIRFSNPKYNTSTKKFKIDVEYLSDTPNIRIFGQNVRFFYDGAIFENANVNTVRFTDFAPGYGPFSPYPNYMQNTTSGKAFFNLQTINAQYINSAIAINDINATPVIISTDVNNWTKLFTIELTTRNVLSGDTYPVLIWDHEDDETRGSYVNGPDGNVITHVINPQGVIRTGPTDEVYQGHFNWSQTPGSLKAPWGFPNKNNKFTVA